MAKKAKRAKRAKRAFKKAKKAHRVTAAFISTPILGPGASGRAMAKKSSDPTKGQSARAGRKHAAAKASTAPKAAAAKMAPKAGKAHPDPCHEMQQIAA